MDQPRGQAERAALLLLPAHAGELKLGGRAAQGLADLGITHASVFLDDRVTAFLVGGATFDVERTARMAADLLAGPSAGYQVLQLVGEVEISSNRKGTWAAHYRTPATLTRSERVEGGEG